MPSPEADLGGAAFIRAHTDLAPAPFVPGVLLHQADEPIGLWELTESEYSSDRPPPFWAFAWAGGQALARYLLEHPEAVRGRTVLDLAAGSGVVGIAALKAGAARVRAVEVDSTAVAAIELNAAANGVAVDAELGDILAGESGGVDVVLAGDVFYSKAMSDRMLAFLRRAARHGARVLVGDPERAYLPRKFFTPLTRYDVPVPHALESVTVKHTTVWELA